MSKRREKIKKIDSLIVVVILLADTLSGILAKGFGIETGANLYVLVAVFALGISKLIYEAASGVRGKWTFTYKSLFLLISVFILYAITYMTCEDKYNYTVIQLIFYAVLPAIVIGLDVEIEYVLRYAVYISLLTVFALDGFLAIRWDGYEQADLGKVYSLITMLICVMFHLRFYGKKSNLLIKLIYCYDLYVLIRVVMVANRGAVLGLLITAFVLFLHKFNNDSVHTSGSKRIITIMAVVCLVMVINNHMDSILESVANMCTAFFGSVPSAITKMQSYASRGDLTNGRSDIMDILFTSISESPIYGHGLNMFSAYTDGEYPYPHNFILQYLFEGGILFAFFPVFFSVGAVVKVILGLVRPKEQYILAAMLVCQCFPKLLLSTNVWFGTAIWMLIVFSANNLFFMGSLPSRKKYINRKQS